MTEALAAKATTLAQLHSAPEILQVVNVWDVISAKTIADLPGTRARLGVALGLVGVPQLVLRMGYADQHATTPRRSVEDVVRS